MKTPEIQYKMYIRNIQIQLEDAKSQIKRIPELEEKSKMTFEEFVKIYGDKFKF